MQQSKAPGGSFTGGTLEDIKLPEVLVPNQRQTQASGLQSAKTSRNFSEE